MDGFSERGGGMLFWMDGTDLGICVCEEGGEGEDE